MRKLEGRVEVCRDLIVKWTEKENLLYVSLIIEICLVHYLVLQISIFTLLLN